MKKLKVLSVLTACVLALSLVFAACEDSVSFANQGDSGGGGGGGSNIANFQYSGSTTITITSYTGPGGNVIIPASIDGKSVTAIGDYAFQDKHLTNVVLPSSVTTIEWYAFSYNKLTSVSIPPSVTYIASDAFKNNQLTSITIPNSVTCIYESTFANNRLTSVTIPNSVTTIRSLAFAGNQLISVTIGKNVNLYGTSFYGDDGHVYFSNGFEEAYNDNGKAAGTYTRLNASSDVWTKQ